MQHHTKTHLGTHSLWQHVCFLSKPRSPVLQISLPDNSDNPGAAKSSAEQIISLLRQAHRAAECRSASICVCFMMTLIGKSIFWALASCLAISDLHLNLPSVDVCHSYESSLLVCCAASVIFQTVNMRNFCMESKPFCPLVAILHVAEGSLGRYHFWRWFFFLPPPGILPCWLRWVGLSCRTGVSVWLQIRGASCPEVLGMQQQYRHRQPDEKSTATKGEKFPLHFYCRKDTSMVTKGSKEDVYSVDFWKQSLRQNKLVFMKWIVTAVHV